MDARLDPAVAAVRRAVRAAMVDVGPGRRVLVACSGGADSMSLAAATCFEAGRAGWLVGAVVVDHGIQEGSRAVAESVAGRLTGLEAFRGIDPVEVVSVHVGKAGGPEAAAREARYQALRAVAAPQDAIVLLGHTRDDQAETVLLGLARGSGARSLAGMRPVLGPFRRPLLVVTRAQTAQAARELELATWEDPANQDPSFARVRVRRTVLPVLEKQLGPGVAEALARTAALLAEDADALDSLAVELARAATRPADGPPAAPGVEIRVLAAAPAALRTRVLRLAALAAGCPGGELFAVHVHALDALVSDWQGQGAVDLPGHVKATRRDDAIWFARKRR